MQVPKCNDDDGGKGDYLKWLEQQGKDKKLPQPRLHELHQEFNRAPLEEHRRLANQTRMEEGLDTVPWRDPPSTGILMTTRHLFSTKSDYFQPPCSVFLPLSQYRLAKQFFKSATR